MSEIQLIKSAGGMLRPANQVDADSLEKIRNGALIQAEIKQPRNPRFHRLFFAMLSMAYELWEPPEVEYNGLKSVKSFERFRKEAVVRAGFFTVTTDMLGNTKLEPESISFSSMDDTRFDEVYRAVFNVVWDLVLSNVPNMTPELAEQTINQMLDFDG